MASTGAIKMGAAWVQLMLDDAQFKKGLKAASLGLEDWGWKIRKIGDGIGAIGGSIEARLTMAQHAFQETGSALARLSMRTGISVEKLSALQYAAEENAVDGEKLNVALTRMAHFMQQASHGGAAVNEELQDLGLTFQDLNGLSADQALEKFADGLQKLEPGLQRVEAARKIFGRGSAELVPLLSQGAEGLKAMYAEASAHGRIFSTEDAAAALELDKASRALTGSLRMITLQIGAGLAPYATAFYRKLTEITTGIVKWMRENRGLVHVLDLIGITLVVAGGAIAAFGTGLFVLGVILPGVTAGLSAFAAVLAVVFSPAGAVVVGAIILAGLLGVMAYKAGLVESAFRGVKTAIDQGFESYDTDKTKHRGPLASIVEAIKGGELSNAWEQLTIQLEVVWIELMAGLKMAWYGFGDWLGSFWDTMMLGLRGTFGDALKGIAEQLRRLPLIGNQISTLPTIQGTDELTAQARIARADKARKRDDQQYADAEKEIAPLQARLNELLVKAFEAQAKAPAIPKGLASDYSDLTKFSQYGTFNGAAAQFQFGGTGAAERTAKNTGDLVDLFRTFNDNIRNAPGRFADMGKYD